MGTLSAVPVRGKEVFSFPYDPRWLALSQAQTLDPSLQLFAGPQYLPEDPPNFGLFLDSSPDRWERLLLRRREAALARQQERRERPLLASDYLLGVFDGHRRGGLRFKTDPVGPFLNDNRAMAAPPWTSLRELAYASLQLERVDAPRTRTTSSGCSCWSRPAPRWAARGPRPARWTSAGSAGLPSFPAARTSTTSVPGKPW